MQEGQPETQDIFLWANHADEFKKDFEIELFLFNKRYTPYSVNFGKELETQIRSLFLFDMINFVNLGSGTGLTVRDFEISDQEEDVLLRTDLDKVPKASSLIKCIEENRSEIEQFSESNHEFKCVKGMIAKFAHPGMNPFYIVKRISSAQVLKGSLSWEFNDGKFDSFKPEIGLKIPNDNQVLITGNDIFVFNQRKFETLFDYNYKKQLIADQKIEAIEKQFRLSFPDNLDLQSLIMDNKKVVNKLQKVEIGKITQEQLVDYADEMELDLMTDDSGAIIIMDNHNLDTFVNLINEDYIISTVTGKRYEVKTKKLLEEPEGEPPRGIM